MRKTHKSEQKKHNPKHPSGLSRRGSQPYPPALRRKLFKLRLEEGYPLQLVAREAGVSQSNLAEFQSGTDATNSLSSLRITAIAKESTDIRVTWMTGPGKTNALERTAGAAGSFSNNFTAIFTVTNTTDTTTNYLDVGAATNIPSLYYRVRLVP